MKTYSLNEVIEQHIGPLGTPKRESFEEKLRLDVLGKAINEARVQRHPGKCIRYADGHVEPGKP